MKSSNPEAGRSPGYGIVERESSADATSRHVERIRLLGYTVVPSGLALERVAELGERLATVWRAQVEEFGGEARMSAIGDSLTVRCPLAYDDAFLEPATNPDVLAICRHLIGPYVILMQQNGVINPPRQSHTQVAYHRDLPYQHFVSTRPLAISALFCIDEFRADNGATTLLPGSHRVEAFPSDAVAAELDTPVTAPPGSFIVFDSMVFHRAGTNHSERARRAINQVFSAPVIAQQISLPDALQGRHADDPALARLLGYEVSPPRSVLAWRERRFARLG